VTLHVLHFKEYPFEKEGCVVYSARYALVWSERPYDFFGVVPEDIPTCVLDLILGLINPNPSERTTVTEALESEYIRSAVWTSPAEYLP
jgi:serine/threonine protein kinase